MGGESGHGEWTSGAGERQSGEHRSAGSAIEPAVQLSNRLGIFRADGNDLESPRFRAGDLDADFKAILGQAVRHPIGPFHQHQPIAIEILLRPQCEKLGLVAEAVGVDVDRRRGGRDTLGSGRTWG